MSGTRRQWTDEQRKAIVREFVEGAKRQEVIDKHNLASSVFDRMRKQWETKVKKEIKASPEAAPTSPSTAVTVIGGHGNRLPKEAQEQIIARLNNGEKGAAIARSLGIHISSVYHYAKKWRESGGRAVTVATAREPMLSSHVMKVAERTEIEICQDAAAANRRLTRGERSAVMLIGMLFGDL